MGYAGILSQTAGNVFSQYYKGRAASKSAEFEGKVAENNAFLAEQEARWANRATTQRLTKHFREVGQVQAKARVAFAKGGVQLSSGSPVDAAISTALQADLDAQIIQTEGDIAVYNAGLKARQFETQGQIAEFKGKEARTASAFGIGASLLKGGADAFDLWKTRKKKGIG